jgi:hypothetical protein
MSAIPVVIAVLLCLAAAGVVSWDLAPLVLKPRARGNADAARLARRRQRRGSAGLPAIDTLAYLRPDGVPLVDVAAQYAVRDQLLARNGVALPDRLRETPEPFPFRVPPYYAAYEAEKAERRRPA